MKLIKLFLWLALGVVLMALGLGHLIVQEPGYVLITLNNWVIETSVWIILLVVILLVAALYVLSSLPRWLGGVSRRFDHKLERGLKAYFEGNYKQAAKLFERDKSKRVESWVALMFAAKSRQALGQYDLAELDLQKLAQAEPKFKAIIVAQQMQMAANKEDYEQVWQLGLAHIDEPKFEVLSLQLMLKVALSDPMKVLPLLAKIPPVAAEVDSRDIEKIRDALLQANKFDVIDSKRNQQKINAWWSSLSAEHKLHDTFIGLQFALLIASGEQAAAWTLLLKAQKKRWSDELLPLIAYLEVNSLQLEQIEVWLKEHSNNAHLFSLAGRMCENLRLWGKARDYYWQCLQLDPTRLHQRLALLKLERQQVISSDLKETLLLGLYEHH